MKRICIIPNVSGTGGMVSFRDKLNSKLAETGVETCFDINQEPYQSVLVIGGSRQLAAIKKARQKGKRIIQRLDGINWIHRKKITGLRHTLRAELGNFLQSTIRRHLADHIIYQSEFAGKWWQDWYGKTSSPFSIIHNGVDLDAYSPDGSHHRPDERYRILLVEGSFSGGYENGLENAIKLADEIHKQHKLPIELMVVGNVSSDLQSNWNKSSTIPILWMGKVPRESIPELDRSAHILFASDLHPACPNSVIEAMACGLPVAAFDTGAIRELVPKSAGCVVPYGSDPWKLENPDIHSLADGVYQVLMDNMPFRQAARFHAEKHFNLDEMARDYLEILLEVEDE